MTQKESIYSSVTHPFYKTEDVKNVLQEFVISKLQNNEETLLEDMSLSELSDIIYKLEKTSLSCRMAIERKGVPTSLGISGIDYSKQLQEIPDDLEYVEEENILFSPSTYQRFSVDDIISKQPSYINVSYENDVLRVKTPLTFKRFNSNKNVKANYLMFDYVNAALKNWENKNNTKLMHLIEAPCLVIIKRKLVRFNRTRICDNDNMEVGRIINSIFDGLLYSDNAKNMDLFSCYRECSSKDDEGMEIVALSKANLSNHLDELE